MNVQDERVEAIKRAAMERDGRMTLRCADAFDLAKQLDIDLLDIGLICDIDWI